MICNSEVWKTIYEEDFDNNSFLYHYTNIQKAFKIIDGNKLKFGRINRMNDTLEAKPKVPNLNQNDAITFSALIEFLNYTNNSFIQLLCMSIDSENRAFSSSQRQMYADYSGRGFALPRMWAQYADNNNGTCLVFDKTKLSSLIKKQARHRLIKADKVTYLSHFEPIDLNLNDVIDYSKEFINQSHVSKSINISSLLKEHSTFTQYNYFSKLNDWSGEKEYRFLAFDEDDIFIDKIMDSLVGVVVGEKIDTTNLKIIKSLIGKKVDIMKISFTFEGCMLTTTY